MPRLHLPGDDVSGDVFQDCVFCKIVEIFDTRLTIFVIVRSIVRRLTPAEYDPIFSCAEFNMRKALRIVVRNDTRRIQKRNPDHCTVLPISWWRSIPIDSAETHLSIACCRSVTCRNDTSVHEDEKAGTGRRRESTLLPVSLNSIHKRTKIYIKHVRLQGNGYRPLYQGCDS